MLTNDDARAIATGEGVDTHTARRTAHELIATGTYFDHGQAMLNLLDAFEQVQSLKETVSEVLTELQDIHGELLTAKTAPEKQRELKRLLAAIDALERVI